MNGRLTGVKGDVSDCRLGRRLDDKNVDIVADRVKGNLERVPDQLRVQVINARNIGESGDVRGNDDGSVGIDVAAIA